MAKSVCVLAYGSLCDFLGSRAAPDEKDQRACETTYSFFVRASAKEAFEAAGVPHPEVDLLLINGEPARFSSELQDGDRLEIFPREHARSRAVPDSLVRPRPLPHPRFLVDVNSGKLASALLILGFDTRIDSRLDDEDLARLSFEEKRVLLTRDIGLLKRGIVEHGYWLRSNDPRQQISEVVRRYQLWPHIAPLTRCLECNVPLDSIDKSKARARVPEAAYEIYDDYFECETCEKVFWKGSHYSRMKEWLLDLEREFGAPRSSEELTSLT